MRLIDADVLIEAIRNHYENVHCEDAVLNNFYRLAHEHVIDVVNVQPTAFDVKAVVAELEESRITALNKVKLPIMIVCKHDLQEFVDICFEESKNIVNQLAEEYNNGWILCSDRLPDFLDNVSVCTKSGGRTIAHLKHTPIEWRDMHMNKIDDVIAWKYLDAPYQPKGE